MSEIIQPNEEIRIEDGSKVDLHFSVSIENGVEIDIVTGKHSAFEWKPQGRCELAVS